MKKLDFKDDPTWESVLEAMAINGQLSRFYQLPRHEMSAVMRIHGFKVTQDIAKLFSLTALNLIEERNQFIEGLEQGRAFAILMVLGRAMKCWIESETMVSNSKSRWKTANS